MFGSHLKYWGDCESAEIIKNRTICVREGSRIRNIRYAEDIEKEQLVFVNNVAMHGEYEIFDIPKYTPLRYTILEVRTRS